GARVFGRAAEDQWSGRAGCGFRDTRTNDIGRAANRPTLRHRIAGPHRLPRPRLPHRHAFRRLTGRPGTKPPRRGPAETVLGAREPVNERGRNVERRPPEQLALDLEPLAVRTVDRATQAVCELLIRAARLEQREDLLEELGFLLGFEQKQR